MLRTQFTLRAAGFSASITSFTSSISFTNGSGTYTYDGNGQRVEKVSGGTTIVTIFAGSQVLAEYYNNAQPSSPTNEYIYAGSLMIASIQSGTTDYWHNDHLSPRVRTDTSGNVADQRGTFPFGETWYSPGSSPYMFTSYYRDYEAEGNDYAQARTYVGGLGRFSSPDPVSGSTSDPQSLNRYSYVRNLPHMLTDPFGLTPSCNTAKNPDTSQPQDSNSGAGPSATDSGDPSEAEPQSASQNPCDQDPWYYGGGSGLVSIDSGEGFDPGDGGSGLTGIGSDPFSILNAAFTPTSYQTVENPDCPNGDCAPGTPETITVPVYGNLGLLSLLGGPGGNSSWWGTFGKTFVHGVLHGIRQPGESFAACVARNADETTFGVASKLQAGAVAATAAVGTAVGVFSQIPTQSPWGGSASTIIDVVASATGRSATPAALSAAGTIGGYVARSLGASMVLTRIAAAGAAGLSEGAAVGTTVLAGGLIGLTVGSAINCR